MKRDEFRSDAPAVGWICDDDKGGVRFTEIAHRDLLANLEKLLETNAYRDGDVYCSEPAFASAVGTILSLWFPIYRGMPSVMVSASADASKLRAAVAAEGISWIVADRLTEAHLLTGEALPDGSRVRVLQTFRDLNEEVVGKLESVTGLQVCRCAASDRLGGLIGVSIPDPNADTVTAQHQPGTLAGAQGRLLPGTTARVVTGDVAEKDTWQSLVERAGSLTDEGSIVLKGVGLIQDEETDRCPETIAGKIDVNGFVVS